MIRSDIDRDGKPDPDTAVDYCKETGYVPPERSAMKGTASPSFERPGSAPVEVENPPAKESTSPDESDKPADSSEGPKDSADQTGDGESP